MCIERSALAVPVALAPMTMCMSQTKKQKAHRLEALCATVHRDRDRAPGPSPSPHSSPLGYAYGSRWFSAFSLAQRMAQCMI